MTIADTFEREVQQIQHHAKLEGLKQGVSEGLEQGISQGKLETAKNFLKMGLSVDLVCQGTGLTLEQLKEHGLISDDDNNNQ